MSKKRIPLFSKIFYPIVCFFGLIGLLALFLFVRIQTRNMERTLIEEHLLLAQILSLQIENYYYKGTWPFSTLKKVSESKNILFWRLVNSDGEIELADDTSLWGKKIQDQDFKTKKIMVKDGILPSTNERIKIIIYPLRIKEKGIPWTLRLGISLKSVREAQRELILTILSLSPLLLLTIYLFPFYLAKNITTPIKRLVKATEIVGKGNLDYTIDIYTSDEIGILTHAFNKMVRDLKKTTISLNYFDTIINTMADSLIVTDAHGKIELINQSALKLLGYKKEEILGKNINSLINVESYFSFKEETKEFIESLEAIWRIKDGREVSVLCSCSEVKNKKGEVTNRIYVARDITEIKKTEEELIQAYKRLKETQDELIQTEKIAAIGKLASGTAHEIKNPLSIIMQGIYLVDNLTPEKSQELKETIETIKEPIKRADNVIKRILNYARASKISRTPQEICGVIEEGISLIEEQLKFKNIKIEREYPSKPILVEADRVMLSQVFLNLATNSQDAMPQGGIIKIKVYEEDDQCVIEFEDTGMGIPQDKLPKIFEPFYTTKRPGEGTGLGLAIVELIINRHNGKIDVESKVNQGTKFIIKLPKLKKEEE